MEMGNMSKRQQPAQRAKNQLKATNGSSTQEEKSSDQRCASAGPLTKISTNPVTMDVILSSEIHK